jgi:gliding motility-associated-like protein
MMGVPANIGGYQAALNGDGYIGILTYVSHPLAFDYKEYVCTSFTPLIKGVKYEFSMSVSLADDSSSWATDDLGVYFFDLAPEYVSENKVLTVIPQISFSSYGPITDKANWVRLIAAFVADSAYDNLVIGGFKDYNTMVKAATPATGTGAYYYIDSVVLQLAADNILMTFTDTLLCAGDSAFISYTVPDGLFGGANLFTLQLSNAVGDFSNPTILGSVINTKSGTISAYIPPNLSTGSGYKMRIVSVAPVSFSNVSHQNLTIRKRPAPPVVASNSPVCVDDTLWLFAVVPDTGTAKYNWSGPEFTSQDQNPTLTAINLIDSGVYAATVTINGCTSEKADLAVEVRQVPQFSLGEDVVICDGQQLALGAEVPYTTNYLWNTQSTECCIRAMSPGLYRQTVTNMCGSSSDEVVVHVTECDSCLILPSVFTPNGDGKNDLWAPIERCSVMNYRLTIFNRWGQKLFYSTDLSAKWNGVQDNREVEIGTYYYLVTYSPLGRSAEALRLAGSVTVVR